MNLIKVYEKGSPEREGLEAFAEFLTEAYLKEKNSQRFTFEVKDMYFDKGQEWMYTGLITKDSLKGDSWQTLAPAEYEAFLKKDLVLCDFAEELFKRKLYEDVIDEKPKAIVIDNAEKLHTVDYEGYESIKKAVDGFIEHCGTFNAHTFSGGAVAVDVYCNEMFMVDEDEKFDKINAVASMLCGTEIRGNVFLVPRDGSDNRGFEYLSINGEEHITECWELEDILMKFISNNKDEIKNLHEEFDNHKSEPVVEFMDMDEWLKGEG